MDDWDWPKDVVAVATDSETPDDVSALDLNDPDAIADFLCDRFGLSAANAAVETGRRSRR